MKGLIEKLKMLGYTIKYIVDGDRAIIVRDNTIGKEMVVRVQNDKVVYSEYYKSVQYFGNDKYVVFDNNVYNIVDGNHITRYDYGFTTVEGIIETSLKTSNAIVGLNNEYFGVINSLDITILPLIYSNINLYKLDESYLYYASIADRKVLFNEQGNEYTISDLVKNNHVLVLNQGILIVDKLSKEIKLYDLDCNLKVKGTKLVKYKDTYDVYDEDLIVYKDLTLATDIK